MHVLSRIRPAAHPDAIDRIGTRCGSLLLFMWLLEGIRSTRLFHPHIPFDETTDLPLGVAAAHHALDELPVLLLALAVLLGAERDHRQQVLDLGEHPLFDDLADL